MKSLLLTIVLLLALCACAPNVTLMTQDGQPAPNFVLTLQTPNADEIKASFVIVRQVKSNSKYELSAEYLDLTQEYHLTTANTAGLYMLLRVQNPKMWNYSVMYSKTAIRPKGSKTENDTVYLGNEPDKTFTISLPLNPDEWETALHLFKGKSLLFMFGDFRYSII